MTHSFLPLLVLAILYTPTTLAYSAKLHIGHAIAFHGLRKRSVVRRTPCGGKATPVAPSSTAEATATSTPVPESASATDVALNIKSHSNRISHSAFSSSAAFTSTSMTKVTKSGKSSSTKAPTTTSTSVKASSTAPSGTGQGLFGVTDATCGASGATSTSPNGAESWLDCGISESDPSSGWTPPFVSIDQVKAITLEEALSESDSVFSACKPYVHLFNQFGEKYKVPPIFLASFAMQESSCQSNESGDNGGAFGLMQITVDKCGDAPDGNCNDPSDNIETAAAYFASTLSSNGGNLLTAIATYNGWYEGMSYTAANAIRDTCCECVNNIDYLTQFLNGWAQGKDGSQIGSFQNAVC